MHNQSFAKLQSHLLRSGVEASHVKRITAELSDHLEDLRHECIREGASADEALEIAKSRLGDQKVIADRMLEFTELKTWVYRYPRIARAYLPIAYAVLLPVSPLFAGIANPSIVARWGAALMLSGAVTATMMLCMQLAIVLT